MKKEFIKKSGSYALIPLGVGAGQYIGDLVGGEQSSTVTYIAILSVLASIVTFLILMVFLPWWESKKGNLGKSKPVPVYWSPVLWVPLAFVAIFVVHRVVNA
ncbi:MULTISPECIES: hypothetical protein [unclassified Microbulbifer]|uniref:hypothetical protein n=1 Tax=unclassified Microbulbifer TaxID=2619833 RepID=UPI001E2D2867|nr:hypothetical protein [Microbulbifer sp. YPW16]UHQ53843.1 hypothetical protein LVE68_09985 [Microbulbifer sp. YPW16]